MDKKKSEIWGKLINITKKLRNVKKVLDSRGVICYYNFAVQEKQT